MAERSVNGRAQRTSLTNPPPLPKGYDKHHIIFLEAIHLGLPELDFPHDITVYQSTAEEEVAERIRPGTIVISNVVNVTPKAMEQAPNLQLLAVYATGMGWVDKEYCAKRGITVINCPHANIDAVSEHFLTLYFSSRKKVPEVDWRIRNTSEWFEKGSLTKIVWPEGAPLGVKQETLGIIGYGALGKNIEKLTKGLGFRQVIVAERQGVEGDKIRPGRTSFQEVLKTATTLLVACPRDKDTINLIDEKELAIMRKDVLIVNIARGGIVNEAALVKALKERRIFGAATDVFDEEPSARGRTPLLPADGEEPIPNLIVSSHVAWFSGQTIITLQQIMKNGLEAFVYGKLYEEGAKHQVAVHDSSIWK